MTSPKADLQRRVLALLKAFPSVAFRPKDLAKQLRLATPAYREFFDVLDDLVAQKKVLRTGAFIQGIPHRSHLTALLSVHPQGFGFAFVESEQKEYYVHKARMGTALDGDTVEIVLLAARPGDDRREAEVTRVVKRGRTQAVGTLKKRLGSWFVVPDDARIPYHLVIPDDARSNAKADDKVVVSLEGFEDPHEPPTGRVIRVLGPSDDAAVRVLALALSLDIRGEFPDEVEAEAEALPAMPPADVLAKRLDLRDYPIFTIDPVDAKDFDDAIHILPREDGAFDVGVHIADVSAYVTPGSAIDKEAYLRGTSVYLVDRVIPMLPERLSNDLCSLRPRVDRLAYSCMMVVEANGAIRSWRAVESIIHSKERFSYEEAQIVLEGKAEHPLAEHLHRAQALAKTLTARRFEAGALQFDLPEVKIRLDENGKAIGVQRKERLDTHKLIEEFMLLANQATAQAGRNAAFVYRIHDRPDAERISALADYVKPFGYTLPFTAGNVSARDLNRLLQDTAPRPDAVIIHQAALRSMAKARYSAANIGHYGLGFAEYTHFTSPIRRYPDLIAHRLLKAGQAHGMEEPALETQCQHLSGREKAATEAERESVKLKQVEYLADHVGDVFDGVITSVTRFGFFVELSDVLVDGLVHVRDLDSDYYEYDERRFVLRGKTRGKSYRPGDPVKVLVARVSTETRQVDLLPV